MSTRNWRQALIWGILLTASLFAGIAGKGGAMLLKLRDHSSEPTVVHEMGTSGRDNTPQNSKDDDNTAKQAPHNDDKTKALPMSHDEDAKIAMFMSFPGSVSYCALCNA